MVFKLRMVRRVYLGLIASMSLACIVLACSLYANTVHEMSAVGVSGLHLAVVTLSVLSTTRCLNLCRKSFIVAIELTWSFATVPFEIILCLFFATVEPPLLTDWSSNSYLALLLLSSLVTFMMGIYVAALLTLGFITQSCYDTLVFYKPIDASPSPFPLSYISTYLGKKFSCCGHREKGSSVKETAPCLPGCSCDRKVAPDIEGLYGNFISEGPLEDTNAWTMVPVIIPTEDQRRNSVTVTLPFPRSQAS